MKKIMCLFIVVCLVLCSAGCQSSAQTSIADNSQPQNRASQSAALNGKTVENERFSILVPQGWEVMDVDGGVQIYKMSGEVFELHFRGLNMNDTEAKLQVESTAKKYDGTEPKQVGLLGKQFWTTTFTANDVNQVTNLCIEDGVMISVKYGGSDDETNPDFQAILDSIVFK